MSSCPVTVATSRNAVVVVSQPSCGTVMVNLPAGSASAAAALAAISAHEASADPHPQYLTAAEGDAAYDASGAAAAVQLSVDTHAARTDNPHAVTAAQVGLGSVNNTADAAKPVSTAQAAADAAVQAFAIQRANHTGSQAISTVTGLQTALDGKETSGAAAAAVAAHVAVGDPHPQYLTQAEGDTLYAPAGSGASAGPEAGIWRTTRDPGIGWITHQGNALTGVAGMNSATFVPLRIGAAGSYSELSVYCQAGAAGAQLRAALYHAAADNMIGALAVDFGTAALDAAGMKSLSVAPVSLAAGLYYVVLQASSAAPTYRGGSAPIDSGAGILGNIIYSAGIGRIVSLGYSDPWPADMTAYDIGVGPNQVQLLGAFFCPCALLR